jgi:hypothetical protein
VTAVEGVVRGPAAGIRERSSRAGHEVGTRKWR